MCCYRWLPVAAGVKEWDGDPSAQRLHTNGPNLINRRRCRRRRLRLLRRSFGVPRTPRPARLAVPYSRSVPFRREAGPTMKDASEDVLSTENVDASREKSHAHSTSGKCAVCSNIQCDTGQQQ